MKDLFGNQSSLRDIEGQEYPGRIVTQTADALLFNEGEREIWLPISQVRVKNLSPAPEGLRGEMAIVTIPDWLAKKHGLEPDDK
jgi:hypothetical protein